jgi:hypothetical protein
MVDADRVAGRFTPTSSQQFDLMADLVFETPQGLQTALA